ncbi:MAG: hypothetical protein JKY55_13385, partial [Aliivibrio sp.]|uniref:FimV/HubP family polar landmark protein n=1 Tax=Aliivibrio sp. TaxID=1872443 RepID=UPI001A61294F|nr:hypothetical protein [Aliivibrio sp.]
MSNVLKYIHRALTPIVIVMAIQVSAASIKIVGPDGEQKAEQAPSSSSQVVRPTRVSPSPVIGRSQAAALPITYGPTSSADTLWSIATKLRPSTATTIQQTVLAIYRLNPQAFEDNNIHSLHSNSVLRIPSLTQVRNESQASAVRILREHQALLNQVNAPVVVATPVPIIPKISEATASARPSVVKPVAEIAKTKPVVIKSTISDAELMALKKELESNEVEYSALEESNHTLRLKLANVQYEVEALKDAISDEDRIRDEVQKFIDEQKLTLKKEVAVEISLIDKIAESPAMIIALALIPGSMIAGLIAFLLFRRKKEAVEAEPEEPSVVNVEPEINMDDDIPELTLSDDDDELLSNFDDETEELEFDPNEAFGDDSVDPFVSTEEEVFEDKSLDGEDPFAVIDDALQEELINEETEVTSNNFSVDAGVKALGLEEMERALDEIDSGLNTEDDTDEDFDLSLSSLEDLDGADDTKDGIDLSGDDSDLSKDSIALDDDERKGSTESSDDNLDFEWDAQESEEDTFSLESTDEVEVNSNDLDFDTLLDTDASVNRETDSTDFDLDGDTHDELFASSSIESSELNAEDTFELSSDSTKLLDEVMEQSNEEGENSDLFEIDPQNTELLDELLAEHSNVGSESDSETEKVAADSEFEIDEQSTELLDELLSESVESDSETEKVATDSEFKIDEQSTELLDELLSESVESDSETEKV